MKVAIEIVLILAAAFAAVYFGGVIRSYLKAKRAKALAEMKAIARRVEEL